MIDFPRWFWQPILRGMILRRRPARVAHQYQSIWRRSGSPLREDTARIARGIQSLAGDRWAVVEAYRYGEPSLETALSGLTDRSESVIVLPLFPQRTSATTGTAIAKASEVASRLGLGSRVQCRLLPPDDPGYIAALVARWEECLATEPEPDHLIVSFHGIPVRYDRREQGGYSADCRSTFGAFLAASGWPPNRATLAYQSRFGPEPWLTPATADLLERLPTQGLRRVAVMAPGFLTEGLETLEELAIRGRESFVNAGGVGFTYVPAVADHPALLSALLALADS